jgi:hypothetical protein
MRLAPRIDMAKLLTSDHCPNCGSPDYITLHSEWGTRLRLTLMYNRRCADCGVAYTPPTPRWLAWAAIVSGGLVGLACVAMGIYILAYADVDEGPIKQGLAALFFLMAVCGASFLVLGLRRLQPSDERAGDEFETEDQFAYEDQFEYRDED